MNSMFKIFSFLFILFDIVNWKIMVNPTSEIKCRSILFVI